MSWQIEKFWTRSGNQGGEPEPGAKRSPAARVALDLAVLEDRTLCSGTPLPAAPAPDPNTPQITQIDDQHAKEDHGVGSFSFQLADADTPLDQLKLSVHTSNGALIPLDKILLEGEGKYRSITLDTADNAFGDARITLTVSDGTHSSDMSFNVKVDPINDAPVTVGLPDIRVNASAGKVVIDLFAAFQDQEDADSQMTYKVYSNSNPNLFKSSVIDTVAGTLTLSFDQLASGTADLTIVATDSQGASVSLDPTATDVKVYNLVSVDNLITPDMGLQRLDLWTNWYLFDQVNGVYQMDHVNTEKLARYLEAFVVPGVPIVYNIEDPLYENNPDGRDRLAEVFYLSQLHKPDTDFGLYRILPSTEYHSLVNWFYAQYDQQRDLNTWSSRQFDEFKADFDNFVAQNELFRTQLVSAEFGGKSLAELIDTINPSFYTPYRNTDTAVLGEYREVGVDAVHDMWTLADGTHVQNGQTVRLLATNSGRLPTGLTPWVDYYVVNSTGNEFQLATTMGGKALDVAVPTGTVYLALNGTFADPLLDPAIIGWQHWVEGTIAEARKFGKPVNGWISPSLQAVGEQYLEKEAFRLQLDTLAELADSIVVYEEPHHSAAFHQNAGWMQALREFMNDHRLEMPTFRITIDKATSVPAPVANNDLLNGLEDTPLKVLQSALLGNDQSLSGRALTASLVSGPQHGQLTTNSDGSWTYTPTANYNGADYFEYRVSDGLSNSNIARVNLQLGAVNDAPVARADSYGIAHNTPLTVAGAGVLGNDVDVDLDPLTAQLLQGPAHGTLQLQSNGQFTYTPHTDYAGADKFTYQVSDGHGGLSTASVDLVVAAAPVYAAPFAQNDTLAATEDTPLKFASYNLLTNDTSYSGKPLTAKIVSGAQHGLLTTNSDGTWTYTPNANFNGTDYFEYQVSDGLRTSNTARVNLQVNAVNDAPIGKNDAYEVQHNTKLAVSGAGILGNDVDVDFNPLTAQLVQGPAHGTLQLLSNGQFTYTPVAGYSGADRFTYRVLDGFGGSSTAVVDLNVAAAPVYPAPVAQNDALNASEDVALKILPGTLLANDSTYSGQPLTAKLVSGVQHGTLTTNSDGTWTYTPNANYNGTDYFEYRVSDGARDSNVARVNLQVNAVNDAPVARNDQYEVQYNTPLKISSGGVLANDSDVDVDNLTAQLVQGPAHGTLQLQSNGQFTYTPVAGYSGADRFTYRVLDGLGGSSTAIVALNVAAAPVYPAPVAQNDALNASEDAALKIVPTTLLANDSSFSGQPLTAKLVSGVQHGTLTTNSDGTWTYTPNANYNGADYFEYRVSDGARDSNVARVNLQVNPVNDAPVARNDLYEVQYNTPLNLSSGGVLANDADIDADGLSAQLVKGPANGTLALQSNGLFTYTPNAGFSGNDRFTYRVSDGQGGFSSADVVLKVATAPVVPAPTAGNDSLTTLEDTPLKIFGTTLLQNDQSFSGRPLTTSLVSGPQQGKLVTNSDGSWTYTPGANFAGTDYFEYRVSDGQKVSNIARVELKVGAVNDAPVARADSYAVKHGTLLSVTGAGVLSNDTDVERDSLAAEMVDGPGHGTLVLRTDGQFEYRPEAGFSGRDQFTYRASDGRGGWSTAQVALNVAASPIPDPPTGGGTGTGGTGSGGSGSGGSGSGGAGSGGGTVTGNLIALTDVIDRVSSDVTGQRQTFVRLTAEPLERVLEPVTGWTAAQPPGWETAPFSIDSGWNSGYEWSDAGSDAGSDTESASTSISFGPLSKHANVGASLREILDGPED
ncbi:MAG: Ig-like domain-containing protein [Pirellulales bacterium]